MIASHGRFVLEANPRFSDGEGAAFTQANIRDLDAGELREILAGVDAAESPVAIDDRRVGIFGTCYRGTDAVEPGPVGVGVRSRGRA